MSRCSTCRYWGSPRPVQIFDFTVDPSTREEIDTGHRRCSKILSEEGGFEDKQEELVFRKSQRVFISGGEVYRGVLITRGDFGCSLWTRDEAEDGP